MLGSSNLSLALHILVNGQQAAVKALNEMKGGIKGVANEARNLWKELNGFSVASQLAGMAGGTLALKGMMDANLAFEKIMLESKQLAEMSDAQITSLSKFARDKARDLLANPMDIAEGIRTLANAGMKYEAIAGTIEEASRAALVFRSSITDIANMDFDIQEKFKVDPRHMAAVHDMLYYHAKSGRFEAKSLSQEAPAYLNAMQRVGMSGEKALNFAGALTQVMMKASPATQPAMVSTFIKQGLAHIYSPRLDKHLLQTTGIDVHQYAPHGKFYGEGGVQGILDLARAMKAKGLEDPFKLAKAGFMEEESRTFWVQMMKYSSEIEAQMKAAAGAAGKAQINHDVAEIKQSNFGKVQAAEIETAKMKVGEVATTGTGLYANLVQWASEHKGDAAMATAGTLIAGRLAWKKYNSGSGPRLPGMPGGTGAGKAGVQQVFVTNWPKGMLAPGEDLKQKRDQRGGVTASAPTETVPAKPGWKGKLGTAATNAKGALKFGAIVNGAFGAYEAYDVSKNKDLTDSARATEYSKIVGGVTGGTVGATVGGMVGGIFGGVGAIPGAMIGGAVGDWAGRELGGSKIVIENVLHIDGKEVARTVNEHNARDARRH